MTQKIRASLATVILASVLQGTPKGEEIKEAYVNNNHRQWTENVTKTESLRKNNPSLVDKITENMFFETKKREVSKKQIEVGRSLPEYAHMNNSELSGLFQTCAFYACKIPKIVDKIEIRKDITNNIVRATKEITSQLMNDATYQLYFRNETGKTNFDCVAYSTTAAASALRVIHERQANGKLELITGLFFDKIHAPKGIGHQWIKLDGQIIDLAIEVPVKKDAYVPIVGIQISIDKEKITYIFKPTIYCLTPEKNKEEQ